MSPRKRFMLHVLDFIVACNHDSAESTKDFELCSRNLNSTNVFNHSFFKLVPAGQATFLSLTTVGHPTLPDQIPYSG